MNKTIETPNWWRLMLLRHELSRTAETFGWDSNLPWINALAVDAKNWPWNDMTELRRHMSTVLNRYRYCSIMQSHVEMNVRYVLTAPSPAQVLDVVFGWWRNDAIDLRLTIESTRATLSHWQSGELIAVFRGCGRLMQSGHDASYIENSLRLIHEFTGYLFDLGVIIDGAGTYAPIVVDRVGGVWCSRVESSTRI